MEKLLSRRLESIAHEKSQYKKKLKTISPTEDLTKVAVETFQIPLNNTSLTKELESSDQVRGVLLHSSLKADEHRYVYFINNEVLDSLIGYFQQHNNEQFTLHCPGYSIGSCHVEIHLILIKTDETRVVQKVNLGEQISFTVLEDEEIKQIKLTARVKDSGTIYLHNPYLNVVKPKQINNAFSVTKKPKKIKDMNVIFIADEFTTRSFDSEFKAIKVSPGNWEEELSGMNPDLFFCESAWQGNNGLWTNKVGTGGPRDNSIVLELVQWCQERGIPTIFWNKEDPFHYNAFVETAKYFDYVFTTDANSVAKYKDDGCPNVFTFPFAAQPKYHNPIEKYNRQNKVVFAGAYYGDKFPERTRAMDNMIEISGKHGIDIYDRNYNNPSSPNQFPERFKQHIVGTLKGDQIERAYKGYKVSLNVNSIVDSPTMFSRRVFEILASNTPVVSSESLGIENLLGDLVIATSDFDKLKERIDLLFNDELYFKKIRLQSLRKVLEEHSYKVRVEEMFNNMGYPFLLDDLAVTAVAIVRSHEDYKELLEQYNRQTFKNKKLVILLDIFDGYLEIFNRENNKDVKTYLLDYIHHYDSINDIIQTDYFAPLHLENYYGPNYLKDMILSTLYTDETIIVKQEGEEYTYVSNGKFDLSLLPKTSTKLLTPVEFINNLEDKLFFENWFKYGHKFFNIDEFNIVLNYKDRDFDTESINL
ncbi:CgeB family protein [Bacillus pinisoli]|uniref:CgeB family protein n=1 Tax=Bacillus pinisoli TaxID=2901866 RepID=UPI001FF218DF|nr:glycosyltransferase [Bacillus pinisoli]